MLITPRPCPAHRGGFDGRGSFTHSHKRPEIMKHKESLISAHHNYLVNNMLTPGFVLGDPHSETDFWLLADVVLPGESTARISGRLFDTEGRFLLQLDWNRIGENPGRCSFHAGTGGFRIVHPSGESLLTVHTQHFANGYLTRIEGRLHDREGRLRMEPSSEGIQVHGEALLTLHEPFRFSGPQGA